MTMRAGRYLVSAADGPTGHLQRPPVCLHRALAGRKALVLSAISEGRARGLGQMPAGLYQGKEAEEVADFVAKVAGH